MTVVALAVPGTHDPWPFAERGLQARGGALLPTLAARLALTPRQ